MASATPIAVNPSFSKASDWRSVAVSPAVSGLKKFLRAVLAISELSEDPRKAADRAAIFTWLKPDMSPMPPTRTIIDIRSPAAALVSLERWLTASATPSASAMLKPARFTKPM